MSSPTTLARPYARAAFDAARDQQALAAWEDALALSAQIAADERVRRLIGHPRVEGEQLRAVFMPETPAGTPEGYGNFIAVLESNGRLAVLPQIADKFSALKDEAEQTLAVTVRSAHELDASYRDALKAALSKRFGKRIELNIEIEPGMLGGATIKAGDLMIDGSVRGKLDRMATALTS